MVAPTHRRRFGVWEAGRHLGSQDVNEPGGTIWNELATTDPPPAGTSTPRSSGWRSAIPFRGFDYTTIKVGGRDVGGISLAAEVPHPFWGVYFAVSDTDETVRLATEPGAKVLKEPSDSPMPDGETLQDPQGAVFSLIVLPGNQTGGQWPSTATAHLVSGCRRRRRRRRGRGPAAAEQAARAGATRCPAVNSPGRSPSPRCRRAESGTDSFCLELPADCCSALDR